MRTKNISFPLGLFLYGHRFVKSDAQQNAECDRERTIWRSVELSQMPILPLNNLVTMIMITPAPGLISLSGNWNGCSR